jgi:hypothetical protein
MTKILCAFGALQLADIATTILALRLGGTESNPLIRVFMYLGPVRGLLVSKTVVVLLAIGCALLGKLGTLRCANVVFAGIVAWNLIAIARLL